MTTGDTNYQAGNHPYYQDSDIIRYQIDPEKDLLKLKYELQGYTYNYNKGSWERNKGHKGSISDEHVNSIVIQQVSPFMGKHFTLSDFEKDRLCDMAFDVWQKIFKDLLMQGYTPSVAGSVARAARNYAFPNMMRSKEGQTARQIITRIEKREVDERSQQQKEGMFGGLFGKKQGQP